MEGVYSGGEYLTKDQLLQQMQKALFEAFTTEIPDLESKMRVKNAIQGFMGEKVAPLPASEILEKYADPNVSVEAFIGYLEEKGLIEEENNH